MSTTTVALQELARAIDGRVITADAPDYDEQRAQYTG